MKKAIYFILAFAVLFFMTSCSSDNGSTTFSSPYIGGDNGLKIEFMPNNPPDEIYDNGNRPFNIVLKVKNDGEFKVAKNNIIIKATGFSPSDFGSTASALTVNSLDTDLEPKSKSQDGTVRPGGETYVTLPRTGNLAYKSSISGSGELKLPIGVDVCYLYKSSATTLLCVTENLLRPSSNDVCEVNAEKQVFASSSPVKVSKVTESATKDKIRVEFEITFNGKGTLIRPNNDRFSSSNCDAADIDFDKVDYVYVKVDPENQWGTIRCNPLNGKSGFVKLYDKTTALVTCEIPISYTLKGNYVKPLNIDVYYQYKEQLIKEVAIKHVETG